jgi:hypothetical protein
MTKANKERIKDLERALTRAKYPKLPYVEDNGPKEQAHQVQQISRQPFEVGQLRLR